MDSNAMLGKEFSWPIRVYYEDTDAGGVVYHANYLMFFERARTEMLRALGFEQDDLRREEDILFAVRSMHIDFIKPAVFNDLLDVRTSVTEMKKASMLLGQSLHRENELLCQAEVRIACLSARVLKPGPVPASVARAMGK